MKSARRRSACILGLEVLEDRSLLSGFGPPAPFTNSAPTITVVGTAAAGGYQFLNFNGPNAGTNAGAGSNENGISNSGRVVGFDIDNNGGFHNFTVNPLRSPQVQELNINGSTAAQAFGINKYGIVVGSDGNGDAFYFYRNQVHTFIPLGGSAATAFGINDHDAIVGQYTDGAQMPGFILPNAHDGIRLDAPSGPDVVNAQGINNEGLVVGFYVGTDGQDHGFIANQRDARFGQLTGTAVADPTIPNVPGEPGATFVFSQILGVNDQGIAVGYYGDSTTSQHGFLYNTNTGQYTFLDDPSEAFHNGVEVTQITGINNSGEITGFYSDANGVFHSFVANNGPAITVLGTAAAGGYQFLNFNGPNAGTNAGAGSNENGISNSGTVVGFDIDNNGGFHNFTVNPLGLQLVQELNINGSTAAQAFGINKYGTVVGSDGNGNAFYLSGNQVHTFIPLGGSAATAFGINDRGTIVGQYTDGAQMPGFIRINAHNTIRLDAPSGPDIVNAQSINNKGLVVGFYVGTDGQDHGFIANQRDARNGQLTVTAVADPTIPNVPGEPGATFVFSQILGVNDQGIAVGYYGDSTTSQHGFLYNTRTGQYTFLDDPSEAFHNGVEVTQITGINDSGEITGFYSDANGVFHSFVANPAMP